PAGHDPMIRRSPLQPKPDRPATNEVSDPAPCRSMRVAVPIYRPAYGNEDVRDPDHPFLRHHGRSPPARLQPSRGGESEKTSAEKTWPENRPAPMPRSGQLNATVRR